ncbi:MAG TPA: metallophosphoesterase [Gallionella sp.]
MFVFFLILVSAVSLMQVYVFWRAASVPFVTRHLPRRRLMALGILLWVLFVLASAVRPEDVGVAAATAEFFGMTWMGVLFLLSACLLAVEIATGFGFLLKRSVPALRFAALVAGGVLAVLALIQGMRAPVVQHHDVYLGGLPAELDGTVIVALSDLHLGAVLGERWLAARVEQVGAERPDIVVLLGDVFEGHGRPGPELLATMQRLSAPMGVWAVLGNHEAFVGRRDNGAVFEQAGVRLLGNSWVEPRPGLVLAGVDDLSYPLNSGHAGQALAKTLAGRPKGAVILLSHAPLPPEVLAGKGVGLMLSGHTHGGQLWPFGYLFRNMFPLFAGQYEFDGITAIVSRGTGTWGPRMRLWHPAEIQRVTLHHVARTKS